MIHNLARLSPRRILNGSVAWTATREYGCSTPLAAATIPVAEYIAQRLLEVKCDTVFSVSGDYCTEFLEGMGNSNLGPSIGKLNRIGSTNEQEAAYAAEGYAKVVGGAGAICTTYGAGTFCAVNGVTSAYVERVPLIVLNGAPKDENFAEFSTNDVMFHHMIPGGRLAHKQMFSNITCEQVILGNKDQIPYQIDCAIQGAISKSAPVYIEVGREKWLMQVDPPARPLELRRATIENEENCTSAVEYVWEHLQKSERPFILAGVEIQRYGLQDLFEELLDLSGINFGTSLPSKGVLSEQHPKFVGVFSANFSDEYTEHVVQGKDFLLQLGAWETDLGIAGQSVQGIVGESPFAIARHGYVVGLGRRSFDGVSLEALMKGLRDKFKAGQKRCPKWEVPCRGLSAMQSALDATLSYDSFLTLLSHSPLLKESQLVVDGTLVTLGALTVPVEKGQWVNELLYGSIGWSSGGCIGVALGLKRQKRVITLVGDGGLMNCPTGIAEAARLGLDAVFFVFDNKVYGIDQYLADPTPYEDPKVPFSGANQLGTWDWVLLAKAWQAEGHLVTTTVELKHLMDDLLTAKGTHVVQIRIDARDLPAGTTWKIK